MFEIFWVTSFLFSLFRFENIWFSISVSGYRREFSELRDSWGLPRLFWLVLGIVSFGYFIGGRLVSFLYFVGLLRIFVFAVLGSWLAGLSWECLFWILARWGLGLGICRLKNWVWGYLVGNNFRF